MSAMDQEPLRVVGTIRHDGTNYFRPAAPVSVSGLIVVWLLGAFDVALVGYLVVQLWRM